MTFLLCLGSFNLGTKTPSRGASGRDEKDKEKGKGRKNRAGDLNVSEGLNSGKDTFPVNVTRSPKVRQVLAAHDLKQCPTTR